MPLLRKTPLTSLKGTELKRLASLAGLGSSTRKPELLSRLRTELCVPRLASQALYALGERAVDGIKKRVRIVSIDMGIKNLAYAVLDVRKSSALLGSKTGGKESNTSAPAEALLGDQRRVKRVDALTHVDLFKWDRVNLLGDSSSSGDLDGSPANGAVDDEPKPSTVTSSSTTLSATKASTFEPPALARLAYSVVSKIILPLNPTHILIERQRHRSSGSPAVFEWTLRVNMLEGMIWTVLATLSNTRRTETLLATGETLPVWEGDEGFLTYSVSPKRVADYWVRFHQESQEDSAGKTGAEARSSKIEKEAKIKVAESWLRARSSSDGEGFEGAGEVLRCVEPDSNSMRHAFLTLRTQGGKTRKTKKNSQIPDGISSNERELVNRLDGKLDDLADSLLQGVAWVQWELNRRQILENFDLDAENDDNAKPKAAKQEKKTRTRKVRHS